MQERPLISVIIPARNSAPTLKACLESIHNSTYSNFEVIVVDGGSSDHTVDIARSFGAKVLLGNGRGRGADCNLVLPEAKGEIVAFTDADCIVDRSWLERIARALEEPGVGFTGGPDLTYVEDSTPVGLAAGHIHYFQRSLVSPRGESAVIGCNSAFPKKVLLEAGGFDVTIFGGGEEIELQARILKLGYRAKPDPQCIVYHRRHPSLKRLLRRFWELGTGMGTVHRRGLGVLKERKRHIYPLVAGLFSLALLLGLSFRYPGLFWVFPPLLLAYLLFELFLHRYLVKKTAVPSPFGIFLLTSTLCMLLFGLAFLKEQILPRRAKL